MGWKEMIPGAFGSADCKFAGHPCDRERAGALLAECLKSSQPVEYEEFIEVVKAFLLKKNASAAHIAAELAKIEPLFKPWLVW